MSEGGLFQQFIVSISIPYIVYQTDSSIDAPQIDSSASYLVMLSLEDIKNILNTAIKETDRSNLLFGHRKKDVEKYSSDLEEQINADRDESLKRISDFISYAYNVARNYYNEVKREKHKMLDDLQDEYTIKLSLVEQQQLQTRIDDLDQKFRRIRFDI